MRVSRRTSSFRPYPADAVRFQRSAQLFCASTASAIALAASLDDMLGVFTKEVITSIIAPRYFCSTVILCAIERTSVPAVIEACKSLSEVCWQGFQPAPTGLALLAETGALELQLAHSLSLCLISA